MNTIKSSEGAELEVFKTLTVRKEGAVLFPEIVAPPMNLLGAELVRDLVSLIQGAEADQTLQMTSHFSGMLKARGSVPCS